jgi:hypothetical protein
MWRFCSLPIRSQWNPAFWQKINSISQGPPMDLSVSMQFSDAAGEVGALTALTDEAGLHGHSLLDLEERTGR